MSTEPVFTTKSAIANRLELVANNCDGSGPHWPGNVRVLPLGSTPHHGNLILCRLCFEREIRYRKERNLELAQDCAFKLPAWETLKIYTGC